MSEYSTLERAFAKILSRFPHVKIQIKRVYQNLSFSISKKTQSYTCLPIKKIRYLNRESFFGYYDKSPELNGRIIFHSARSSTKKKQLKDDAVDICLYTEDLQKINIVSYTNAYNYQQGSRLQWINENSFVWNTRSKYGYKANMYDLKKDKITEICAPIYDCLNKNAVSLNFERLFYLDPGYGYFPQHSSKFKSLPSYKEDGFFVINIKDNNSKLLFSLEQIINENRKACIKNARHCLNHLMLSPDGKRCIFILRWYTPQRHDSLMLCNIDGTVLKILSDCDMVSHCCWYDNNTIAGWLRNKNENAFYSIDVDKIIFKKIFPIEFKLEDGHPSFYGNEMLFDSYPDRHRMKRINIYNIETGLLEELGSFFEDISFYDTTRCDLHPRWNNNGSRVYFDSVHEGERCLYYVDMRINGNHSV